MIVAICGAGAVGTLIGASLARTCEVRVIVRSSAGERALAARGGLQIAGEPVRPVFVTADPVAALARADVVIVAVKTFSTESLVTPLRDLLPSTTPIVAVQNGIDAVASIETALGRRVAIALAPTTEGATSLGPGFVRRAGTGRTWLGAAFERDPDERLLDALASLLTANGIFTQRVRPIEPALWAKLIVNAAINPLTACAGVTNGALLEVPELRARLAILAREVAAVAAAGGIALAIDDPVAHVEYVARTTAANRSSMLQDLERGRPTEIDAINGAVVRHARRLGIAVPENERVMDEVRRRTNA